MNTPTPRTDAEAGTLIDADEVVPADFARTLERELIKLLAVNATGAARLAHATAQLATERARLDWLEKRGPWESWFQPVKEVSMLLRAPIREGIDAAMKEGAK